MKKLVAAGTTVAVAAGAVAVPTFGASTRTVSVKDNVFAPTSVTVRRGTTVKWLWRGKNPHNVKVLRGPVKFTSPVKTKGSYSRRLTRTGTYRIVCTIHAPAMKMTLRVR